MKNKLSFFFLLFSILNFAQKQDLEKNIKNIIEGKNATIAVSVTSIEDQFSLNIKGDEKLPMMSVFKFHIALAVLDQVDKGKLKLEQKILIKKSDLMENTWSPIREKYPKGNIKMTLGELLKYTVAQSDNNGCDILINLIGGTERIQEFIKNKGITDIQIKVDEKKMHEDYEFMYWNWTTSNAANQLLKDFYDGKIVSKGSTDFLMKILLETSTGTTKIVAQLPKKTPVAHKTGSSGKDEKGVTIAENDIGIVTTPNGKQYAISVFVSDSMEIEAINTKMIADISKIVFDYFSKK